ncbi:hypothetical protein TW85_24695 [Marinomonas sp. S3726]|uniref:TraR/DksA C4-type zinc finger protein n=1 Tax=Marinomonas sp. S3726 TaxID=579484 RepID=UPI0005FA662A|nr:TraR/DksA C4-type zinc finger protein [Marinomonas sp. S3726]KJZ07798.1 hypothetical protein TW85_24695 [Marinomonas sp. S3726]
MDDLDRAALAEETFRAASIASSKQAKGVQTIVDGDIVCEDCDLVIPKRRLEAAPFATRCIRCQQRREKP